MEGISILRNPFPYPIFLFPTNKTHHNRIYVQVFPGIPPSLICFRYMNQLYIRTYILPYRIFRYKALLLWSHLKLYFHYILETKILHTTIFYFAVIIQISFLTYSVYSCFAFIHTPFQIFQFVIKIFKIFIPYNVLFPQSCSKTI